MRFTPPPDDPVPITEDVISLSDLARSILDRASRLDADLDQLRRLCREASETDRSYRLERAKSYLLSSGTIPEREAAAEQLTSDLRAGAKLAEDLRQAQLEAVRSGRSQLSALQSIANAVKVEIELAKSGPG